MSRLLFPGLLFVVAVIFTCCIQVSLCDLGDTCSTNENCTSTVQNSFCDNTICQCSESFYQQANTSCQEKVALGQACTSTTACSDPNAECSGTCQCKSNYYQDGTCTMKVALGQVCTSTTACSDPNAECSGTCQCKSNYYQDGTCKMMTDLTPNNISFVNIHRKNATVMWDQTSDFTGISRYNISWSPDNGVKHIGSLGRSSNITNLNPGVTYTVTVTTILDASIGNNRIGASATVTTIQALMEPCSSTVLCGPDRYFADCVDKLCLCVPTRYRNSDGNCHKVDELLPSSFNVNKVLSWSAEFAWSVSQYVSQAPGSSIIYEVTVNPGGRSNSTSGTSLTVNRLTAGQSYSARIVTKLQQDGKETSSTSTEILPFSTIKIDNNMTCRSGDTCSDNIASCSSTDPKRCLCNQGYFWSGNPLVCKPDTRDSSGPPDYKTSTIAVSVLAAIVTIVLVILSVIFFLYVRRQRSKSRSADYDGKTTDNRQSNRGDALYEVMDGQMHTVHTTDVSLDSGYVNSPRSREEGGYVNSGQAVHMNEYEKLDVISTTPQTTYDKLTSI